MREGFSKEIKVESIRIEAQLEEREIQEKIIWKKKSSFKWLREGERNTKLFNRSTTQQRIQNRILWIENENGDCLETREEIEGELCHSIKK